MNKNSLMCRLNGSFRKAAAVFLTVVIAACSNLPAPVVDRSARNSGKQYTLTEDGLYRVRQSDTLYSIAFNFGLDWKDLAQWNGVGQPYTIWPGQELRVSAPSPPRTTSTSIAVRPAGTAPRATTRPVEDLPAPATAAVTLPANTQSQVQISSPDGAATSVPQTAPQQAPRTSAQAPTGPLKTPDSWLWPTSGPVISTFSAGDPARKGINIGGTEGQNIVAAATGDVVYSGSGLIGFGELIIIKHSDSMLTAYAHNSRRLVQEGERVAAGSRIAEMGQNGQDVTMLHFELRVDGKPVDPLRYLPPR
jgi:lipoprotein NlpD